MKRNLLLILLSGFFWLPTVHSQLLTEIPDTTRRSYPFEYYVTGGPSLRLTTGYQGMRNFYKEQGFEHLNMSEFASIGTGVLLKDRFSIDVIFDLPVDVDETDDIMGNDAIVSLRERTYAVHALFGYLFWKKRYTSLTFQAGVSWQRNRVEIEERLIGDFDFTTANRNNPRGARSIPVFYHSQGALHAAIKLRINYPRSRWLSTDQDLKLGFVSALRAKPWSVNPGQSSNAPVDMLQYIYLSGSIYLFPREQRYWK